MGSEVTNDELDGVVTERPPTDSDDSFFDDDEDSPAPASPVFVIPHPKHNSEDDEADFDDVFEITAPPVQLSEIEVRERQTPAPKATKGKILHFHEAEDDQQLTVSAGEIVSINHNWSNEDWLYCESSATGKEGLVAANFVRLIEEKKKDE